MAGRNQIQKLMADVQDPSDFPHHSEAPGLRLLDSALRCTICSELFDGPVTLKCGHCFCSLCIRQSLTEKSECPACREDDVNEGHLRRNTVMEEAVTAWKACRPYILQILDNATSREYRPSKKRRLNEDLDVQNTVHSSPKGTKQATTSSAACAPSSEMLEASDSDVQETGPPQPDELVRCPVCSKRVKFRNINQHMDEGCTDEPEPDRSSKSQWDNILGSKSLAGNSSKKKKGKGRASSEEEEAPLPKKSYDTLRDKTIKGLLQEFDLPTTGGRQLLIARHQRWVVIYNANLDKIPKLRKTLDSLQRDLQQWEMQQKNKTKHTVIDSDTYQLKQKSEFDKLVAAARPQKHAVETISPGNDQILISRRSTGTPSPAENAIVVDFEGE